jgi:hypothetical protein
MPFPGLRSLHQQESNMRLDHTTLAVVVNAPELFAREDFRAWLANDEPKFTWWREGEPGEFADVVVLVDPTLTGEGSCDSMPGWDAVVEVIRTVTSPGACSGHIHVRLTNLCDGEGDGDTDEAEAKVTPTMENYSFHFGDPDSGEDAKKWWWCLTMDSWDGIEVSETFDTQEEALADAERHLAEEFGGEPTPHDAPRE